MVRWIPPHSTQTPRFKPWQSRAEILKQHLDSLTPEELRQVQPDYYWRRYGYDAWKREQAKANFNPNQPRVPSGNPDGGQWTSGGGGINDPRVISDATPDNDWKPGAEFVANRPRGPRGPGDRSPPLPLHIPQITTGGSRDPVTIVNNAQTGLSTVDEATDKLKTILEKTVSNLPLGAGSGYGRNVHYAFGDAVKDANIRGIAPKDVETTFPKDNRYGLKDTIRTDVVLRNDVGDVIAIYDVKTGNASLDAGRVKELREKTRVTSRVPIIEMHVLRGLSLKGLMRQTRFAWIITLRLWVP